MVVMGAWEHHKTTFILPRISQGEDSLVTPNFVSSWRLVAVQEGVDWRLLVVADAIHKAETIKRRL